MRRWVLIAVAFAVLASPAGVLASHKHHAKPKHCKHGQVLEHKRVKRRRHGKTVHVRVSVCVKRKAKGKPKTPKTVAPATTPAPRTVKLHAHLDPSYTRNPSNPFQVTYAYSASATSEPSGDSDLLDEQSEPAPLPEGVLTLYSDGSLACSINVGGATSGGECPITYSKLGEHTVTTIYDSDEASPATETLVENIEPFATTTTLSASYESLAEAQDDSSTPFYSCQSKYGQWSTTWTLGYLNVVATATDVFGTLPVVPIVRLGSEEVTVGTPFPVRATVIEECGEGVVIQGGIYQGGLYWGALIVEEKIPLELIAHSDLNGGFAPSEASTMIQPTPVLVYPEGDEPIYAEGDEP